MPAGGRAVFEGGGRDKRRKHSPLPQTHLQNWGIYIPGGKLTMVTIPWNLESALLIKLVQFCGIFTVITPCRVRAF